MIIYNKTWLNNLHLHNQAETLYDANCVTSEELKIIKEKYPAGFYIPGLIIRIGLFLLTCITVLFSFGLLTLLLEKAGVLNSFGWPLFLGLLCAGMLEVMVKNKHYYRAGVNDALLWMAAIFIAGALWWMLIPDNYNSGHADYLVLSLLFLAVSLYFTLRYADVLMSAVTLISLFGVVFFFWIRFGFMGTATVPFIMMIAAGISYAQALSLPNKLKVNYYNNCLVMAHVVSLLVLYAAGNYFITDWANHALNGVPMNQKLEVKWAPFFWAWTMLVPLSYVAWGLYKKQVVALRVGLVLIAAAIYTFRTYYHIMSIELAFLIGGIILLAITYTIAHYLKTPKHGFTADDIANLNTEDTLKLEGIIAAATFNHTQIPTHPVNKFGGGDFGGGGSAGKF
jgi:hypothetical protein